MLACLGERFGRAAMRVVGGAKRGFGGAFGGLERVGVRARGGVLGIERGDRGIEGGGAVGECLCIGGDVAGLIPPKPRRRRKAQSTTRPRSSDAVVGGTT